MDTADSLLSIALSAAVPLWIAQVRPNIDAHIADAPRIAQVIAEKGDILQYRSKKKGESAAAFNDLAKGIAILSFMPGGVTCFGQHWESDGHR